MRVNHIRTFDQLISRYGQGHGCEICKPLVGLVLASCWNEYLLKPAHLPLQDTNDRFFANIQKDGTYSIVPRMPAGEVTADGLIAIGQIAKRYSLYSKITGGQRIDLFGATLEQLPEIWQALVEAGFETGHAYGKSLRTVKSCVGSTLVPLRRAGFHRPRGQAGAPLQGPARAAQNQNGGLRLYP